MRFTRAGMLGVGFLACTACATKVPAEFDDVAPLVSETQGKIEVTGIGVDVHYDGTILDTSKWFSKYRATLTGKGWTETKYEPCPSCKEGSEWTKGEFRKAERTLKVNAMQIGKDRVTVSLHR